MDIDLTELTDAGGQWRFDLTDAYFQSVGNKDIKRGKISVDLSVSRASEDSFHFVFRLRGEVVVECSRCLGDVICPVAEERQIEVVTGSVRVDDVDKVTVDENNPIVDVSWLAYEQVALSLPLCPVHAIGECDASMEHRLAEYGGKGGNEEGGIDPRWKELEKLKTK